MTIPYLTAEDPHAAMAIYEKALGATKTLIIDGPGGSVMHAEMDIDGTRLSWVNKRAAEWMASMS